jgi:hypothetical protein
MFTPQVLMKLEKKYCLIFFILFKHICHSYS